MEKEKTTPPKGPNFFAAASVGGAPVVGEAKSDNAQKTVSNQLFRGLTFQKIPGDGHCLFHAVAVHSGTDQQTLRNKVADRIKENRELHPLLNLRAGDRVEDYIQRIRGSEWADQVEITELMRLLGRAIVIVHPDRNPTIPYNLDEYTEPPIFVYYNGHNHYDAFILENDRVNPKEILNTMLAALGRGESITYKPVTQLGEYSPKFLPVGEGASKPPFDLDAVIRKSEEIVTYAEREAAGKDLVLILGNTGAGKSTFVNYLARCEMYEEAVIGTADKGILAKKSVMKIGHGFQSFTELPQIYTGSDGLSFCDCPGFLDNRGAAFDICNAFAIKMIVSQARSIKAIVLLVGFHSLLADRGRGVREASSILKQLFGTTDEDVLYFKDSLAILVTKVPESNQRVNLERLRKTFFGLTSAGERETLSGHLFEGLSDHIGFYDPLDRHALLDRGATGREEMLTILQGLPSIEDRQYLFRLAIGSESQVALFKFVEYLQQSIRTAFESKNFAAVNRELSALDRLQILDYQTIGDAYLGLCEMVRDLIRGFEGADEGLLALTELKEVLPPKFEGTIQNSINVIEVRIQEKKIQQVAIEKARAATSVAEEEREVAEAELKEVNVQYEKAQQQTQEAERQAETQRKKLADLDKKTLVENQRLQQRGNVVKQKKSKKSGKKCVLQ